MSTRTQQKEGAPSLEVGQLVRLGNGELATVRRLAKQGVYVVTESGANLLATPEEIAPVETDKPESVAVIDCDELMLELVAAQTCLPVDLPEDGDSPAEAQAPPRESPTRPGDWHASGTVASGAAAMIRLTPAQVRMLVSLRDGPREIERAIDLITVDRLAEQGLAFRLRDTSENPTTIARLTDRGREVAATYVPAPASPA